jgi:hypothetical protein
MKKFLSVLAFIAVTAFAFTTFGSTKAEVEPLPGYPLFADQDMLVGYVDVSNDADNLYVKYVITEDGWCMTETHLHVGTSEADFPKAGRTQNVVPGNFDYKEKHDPCVTVYELEQISLGDWGAGTELYIAAHAVVRDYDTEQVDDCLVSEAGSDGVLYLEEDPEVPGYPVGYEEPYQTYSGDLTPSLLAWTHSAWAPYGIADAEWISSAQFAEDPDNNTWRLFTRTFNFPDNATNITGQLTMNADNAQDAYVNGLFALDGSPAVVYGPTLPSGGGRHGWDSVESADISGLLQAGSNELWTMTRNYGWPGGVYSNPTGLIYKLCYSYDLITYEEETAWGATDVRETRFTPRGNWATYFTYTVEATVCTLQEYILDIDSVNNNSGYKHKFTIVYDWVNNSFSGAGESGHAGPQTLSEFDKTANEDGTLSYIKFRSDYDDTIYFWFPAFNLLESGDLDYFNVSGDNVYNATGKWTFECKSD